MTIGFPLSPPLDHRVRVRLQGSSGRLRATTLALAAALALAGLTAFPAQAAPAPDTSRPRVTSGAPQAPGIGQAASPSGVIVPGSQWLQGQGVDVMGNGGDTWGTYWQCVELPQMRLYPKFGWPRVYAAGNGGAAYIPEGSPGLVRYNPGSGYVPVPGDLVIENPTGGNQYGHVAVVDYTTGNEIRAVEQNGSATGRHTYLYNGSSYAGGWGTVKAVLHAPQNAFTNPGGAIGDGTFVRTPDGTVYRVAGGAPLYVSTWDRFGGSQPTVAVSQAQIDAMRPYPADGTFVAGSPSGRVYRFAGGAPLYVSTWSSYGGSRPLVGVDDAPLDNPDREAPYNRVRAVPVDGTFISNTADGRVYRVAGGAPLYVASWATFGGPQPTTSIDPWEFGSYQHLRAVPADMFLRGLPSTTVYRVTNGGTPMPISSWSDVGGPKPFTDVDQFAIDTCDHLQCGPMGNLESASASPGTVEVSGWAIDPNARLGPVTIHVYVGGPAGDPKAQGFNVGPAQGNRDDVATAYPGAGAAHGFVSSVDTQLSGVQPVYVYGINAPGTPGGNTLLGTATVTIPTPAEFDLAPAPLVEGVAQVGVRLTARTGVWSPAPTAVAYQWLRDGVLVPGATARTYTPTAADLGAALSARVTASLAGYRTTSVTSVTTSAVLPGILRGPVPKVSGTALVGQTLTAVPGAWRPTGVALTYQWFRNAAPISGATGGSYALQPADAGSKVSVRVTGTLAGYDTLTMVSARTLVTGAAP